MGCILNICMHGNKSEEIVTTKPKEYSWDKKRAMDPKDFMIDGVTKKLVGRLPGQINGQQFIIQNCKNSYIYLFDHINTISVDDCEGCRIFIGPVKTSVFVRDCKDCVFIVSCQQFRTRDCFKIDVFLSCVSQPIIESSSQMRFAPYQFYYPELPEQFIKAGISTFNCTWSDIHDFTPTEYNNYTLLSESQCKRSHEFLPPPADAMEMVGLSSSAVTSPSHDVNAQGSGDSTEDKFPSKALLTIGVDMSESRSVVLRTHGKRSWPVEIPRCLLILFTNHGSQAERAHQIVHELTLSYDECVLLNSTEVIVDAEDGQRILSTSNYHEQFNKGAIIVLEFSGSEIISRLQLICRNIFNHDEHSYYLSSSEEKAIEEIDQFNNYIKIQMNTQ